MFFWLNQISFSPFEHRRLQCCVLLTTCWTEPTGFQFQRERYWLDSTFLMWNKEWNNLYLNYYQWKTNELKYINWEKSLLILKTIFKKIQRWRWRKLKMISSILRHSIDSLIYNRLDLHFFLQDLQCNKLKSKVKFK